MGLDQPAADRQTEPASASPTGHVRAAVEAVEQPRQHVRLDRRAVVADRHFELVAAAGRLHDDPRLRRRVLQRVVQQVADDLFQVQRVGSCGWQARAHAQRQPAGVRRLTRLRHQLRQERPQGGSSAHRLGGVGLRARQRQEAVQHVVQAVRLGVHVLQQLARQLPIESRLSAQQRAGRTLDRRQWPSQLVRHHSNELILPAGRLPKRSQLLLQLGDAGHGSRRPGHLRPT